jgi:hypothetical protein
MGAGQKFRPIVGLLLTTCVLDGWVSTRVVLKFGFF